ncbi:axin interactor, dorsalization-associated protein-like [Rhopilema esculentum]|uniref:axin interactor, dorsalization-associated protein-like n=1 Tax=Rhopilema esculentum TaxID=499914 RepID=UPI0031E3294C
MMPGKFSLKGRLSARWHNSFLKAVDFDRWDHIPEAIIQYQSTAATIENDLLQVKEAFATDQLYNIKKACACFRVRAKTLQDMNRGEPLTLAEIQKLIPMMKHFCCWKAPFPLVVHQSDYSDDSSSSSSYRSLNEINQIDDEELIATTNISGQPLLPMLRPQPGKHRVSVRIKSVGLKHPARLIQPFFSISLKDDVGLSITPTQELRDSGRIEGKLVSYDQEVHIQRYLEDIYKGCAICFELKHYKQKQRFEDTKCYTFLDANVIKTGEYVLNLFKKPVQYNRKKLIPLSTKPLYLYLYVTVYDN